MPAQMQVCLPRLFPKFGRPAMLMPDNFWSNLRQFLFERPVKIREM